jgi:PAS domain S-box-containing protein
MSVSFGKHRGGQNSIWLGAQKLRPLAAGMAAFASFEIAFYFAYRYGMSFSQACASPFWFPDSVLLCALLVSRPRNWWIFILGALPIRLLSDVTRDIPLWFLLGAFAIDTAKGIAAALLLRRFATNPTNPKTTRDFIAFFAIAVLLVPFVAAFGGAALRSALGYDFQRSFEVWFLGDALAQLVVTPVIMYWLIARPWRDWYQNWRQRSEALLLFACIAATGYLAANTASGPTYFAAAKLYAPVPFLFWTAIRFGMVGTTGAIGITTACLVQAAISGHGPFAGQGPDEIAASIQSLLLRRTVPLYLVAASIDRMRMAERALRESEERFKRMAHGAPVLIWMSGTDKLCDFFNQVWLDFTGRTLEQELGNGWAEGVHPDDFSYCLACYCSAFDARRPFEMEYRLRRHDGEYRWILDKGVPRYSADGEFAGYIGSAIDITALKRAEETNRALAHTQRLAVMGELTAAIAHEVRQPMSAISLNAQAAERILESENPSVRDMREMVCDIRQNVVRADAVISRIRTFLYRRDTQMLPVEPNVVVMDALWLISGDALRRGIQIRTGLADELPPVLGDRTQIQQVLLNLIVNAMDAMKDVPVPERAIDLRTRLDDDGAVEFLVADRGCGIPADRLAHVFDSFFTTRADGMGLGLSIARTIVAAHKGRIWAENNSNGGATLRFTVPIARHCANAEAV